MTARQGFPEALAGPSFSTMIERDEAQQIHDDLLRDLHKRLTAKPCEECGATSMGAAEKEVLRKLLHDNDFRGIADAGRRPPLRKMDDVRHTPFPVSDENAAHG